MNRDKLVKLQDDFLKQAAILMKLVKTVNETGLPAKPDRAFPIFTWPGYHRALENAAACVKAAKEIDDLLKGS